ncbi:aminoacyl-tRNA hydrolase [Corynebacterium sp. zg254]|uniref:Peptidyl-tRNA hydrolase n=1 Tax=Corynebacterium zhongnanshanii TaxID=2768834 RepID=A0ABQ6VIZ5_9CORY|nr:MULTISPECIES: aminoacyl-tRNA hydrolase [Corynebacterium]KAB3523071.1 aminoacyl-tRNA hydrolase [Corynebacterium zhongnanshanii]MCR5913835.1 aminoacyl-tRNA hydrolase [Corynebacterium sp. zg254]
MSPAAQQKKNPRQGKAGSTANHGKSAGQASPGSTSSSSGPWLVIGLGNPGDKYAGTRHNIGRMALDEIADRQIPAANFSTNKRANADVAQITQPPLPTLILARPRTFMNLSGGPTKALANFYKVPAERIIVVHDELELDSGHVTLRQGGGDKGHNGLKDISKALGTKDYWRVSCGIGRPPGRMDPAAYVLKPFPRGEAADVAIMCADAADHIERLIRGL